MVGCQNHMETANGYRLGQKIENGVQQNVKL